MADDIDGIVAAFLDGIDDDRLDGQGRLDGLSRKVWDSFDGGSARAWWDAFRGFYERKIGALNLSSKQVAVELRVDPSAVSNFTRGNNNLSGRHTAWLIRRYEISVPRIDVGDVEGFLGAMASVRGRLTGDERRPSHEQYWCLHHLVRHHRDWNHAQRARDEARLDELTREILAEARDSLGGNPSLSGSRDLNALAGEWLKTWVITRALLLETLKSSGVGMLQHE